MKDSSNLFDVILTDPAWDFATWSRKGAGRSPSAHYDTMTLAEMQALPVADFAADNCALFMWTVDWLPPSIPERLAEAWGFRYATRAWCWIKMNPTGWGFFIGKGFYTRSNPEDCLLFVRGKMPVSESLRPSSVMREPVTEELPFIYTPVREHSRKPDEQYRRIEQMYPNRRYLELFARRRYAPHWAIWGNQAPGGSDVVLESCAIGT